MSKFLYYSNPAKCSVCQDEDVVAVVEHKAYCNFHYEIYEQGQKKIIAVKIDDIREML